MTECPGNIQREETEKLSGCQIQRENKAKAKAKRRGSPNVGRLHLLFYTYLDLVIKKNSFYKLLRFLKVRFLSEDNRTKEK